jgi:hypothetical protein
MKEGEVEKKEGGRTKEVGGRKTRGLCFFLLFSI